MSVAHGNVNIGAGRGTAAQGIALRTSLCLLLLSLIAAFAWAAPSQTAKPQAAKVEPVTFTLMPIVGNTYRAMVLFPPAASVPEAQAALNTLFQRTGWAPGQFSIGKVPQVKQFPPQVMAAFTVSTLFPNGQFPVEAIAVAFRKFGAVNMMFTHGGAFQYSGAPHYEDKDVTIDATPGPVSLALHIRIKNPNIERVGLFPPLQQPQAAPQKPAHRKRGVPVFAWVIVAILAAAVAWVLVYALMAGPPKEKRPARKP